MHDTTFCNSIIKALDDKSKSLGKKDRIKSVTVSLSPLSHVKKETLIESYKTLISSTPYKSVSLIINNITLKMNCTDCGKDFFIDSPTFNCPRCNSSSIDISDSREFAIESIETEEKIP